MKVSKFGGSSLANATQFIKVKNIILSDPTRQVIVVSALGKENNTDHKITDLLYLAHAHLTYGVSVDEIFAEIRQKHLSIHKTLHLSFDLEKELSKIRQSLHKNMDIDELVSRGEYLSAQLLAAYLGYTFIDAKELICLQYNGQVDVENTYQKVRNIVQKSTHIVIPGFYGALPNGIIKVMSRGGSDITGSLVAAALDAEIYENWTDVSGILMADPRIVPSAQSIHKMTFAELREMAFMGASVLHEESIQPVKDKNIPLNIRNTNDPTHPGTLILNTIDEESNKTHFITGVTGRENFTVLSIYKEHIAKNPQIIRDALDILAKFDCPLEHLTMGIDSFTIVVATSNIKARLYDIHADIMKQCLPDKITIEEDLALIAVVGRQMKETPGVAGRLFSAMGAHQINIRMIAQGTDEISIIVGISNSDYMKTIQVLYKQFIGE